MSNFAEIYEHCKNEYSEGRDNAMPCEEAIMRIECNMPDRHRYPQMCKALDMAIEALEKQIPKKWIKGNVYRACPTCNHEMPVQRECCDHCGQRIDWSDENAE